MKEELQQPDFDNKVHPRYGDILNIADYFNEPFKCGCTQFKYSACLCGRFVFLVNSDGTPK